MKASVQRLFAIAHEWSLAGRSGRIIIAAFMLNMGLGRLGAYHTSSNLLTAKLTPEQYGMALSFFGLLLLVTTPWRYSFLGRFISALCCALLTGMTADALSRSSIGVTAIFYIIMAVVLAANCLTRKCDA